ncbi:uncharacterized protein [Symphalangus syndactylus]|uniref:uncharacterized protein n=1 Tax=Symphalangus syndactylus TaxID=9590 RepID=UPI003004D1D7
MHDQPQLRPQRPLAGGPGRRQGRPWRWWTGVGVCPEQVGVVRVLAPTMRLHPRTLVLLLSPSMCLALRGCWRHSGFHADARSTTACARRIHALLQMFHSTPSSTFTDRPPAPLVPEHSITPKRKPHPLQQSLPAPPQPGPPRICFLSLRIGCLDILHQCNRTGCGPQGLASFPQRQVGGTNRSPCLTQTWKVLTLSCTSISREQGTIISLSNPSPTRRAVANDGAWGG